MESICLTVRRPQAGLTLNPNTLTHRHNGTFHSKLVEHRFQLEDCSKTLVGAIFVGPLLCCFKQCLQLRFDA